MNDNPIDPETDSSLINAKELISYKDRSDHFLLTALKEGDRQSFEVLFYRYHKSIFYVALKYLKDDSEAESVVQETFLKIWKYRTGIKEELDFKHYLVRVAKGIIFNRFKKQLNEAAYIESYLANAKQSNETEELIYFNDLERLIGAAIEKLPPKRREIFTMSRLNGMSNKEISKKLNLSEKTVENQIASALKTLRHVIRDDSFPK